METLALVHRLSVAYLLDGDHPVRALNQTSLEIGSGELVGILGESGSGKSTLAAAFLRLLPANAQYGNGSIRFRGRDLLTLPEAELRRIRGAEIALIPQDPALALNPVRQVGCQIAEVLRAHVSIGVRERTARVEELLGELGFDHPRVVSRAYPHQLSGGQRQRVVIAQAMACRPRLVIADEPTSKLDASIQAATLSLMREIGERHGMAFVVISHDPTVLAGFVDRVAVMYAGCIVEEGPTEEIFRRPLHPYTQALVRLCARYMPQISPETISGLRARYGLDQPMPVRYSRWLTSVVHGDLGFSIAYNSKAASGPHEGSVKHLNHARTHVPDDNRNSGQYNSAGSRHRGLDDGQPWQLPCAACARWLGASGLDLGSRSWVWPAGYP